jgi:DNA polymerase III subunit gamma/tau
VLAFLVGIMGTDFDDDNDFDNEYEVDNQYLKDDQTDDMFGQDISDTPKKNWLIEAKPITSSPYLVLARKYRPQNFKDLIGQEAMVKTLTNAFKQNRIAHGFMLTGVRGIGKTTTARLIARALNYQSPAVNTPSMDLEIEGIHCQAITQGRHPDVLELDAASNTGVDKMRDILDNVRYGPTQARYKIYIIDEVHMLSTAAFNALLKTLEEPPPHAKFIFATTETQKVPVTILSRCQRFDLRRLERDALADHLQNICAKENVNVDRDGLEQIARAAEGSVRDALSLLDQAIVQDTQTNNVSGEQVREMLGLSDRNRIFSLLEKIVEGNAKDAILEAGEQYDFGASPTNIISSLMEIAHEISKYLIMGQDYKLIETNIGMTRIASLGDKTSKLAIGRIWQMLLTGLDEIKRAPDGKQALEMCLIRLCCAQQMPSPEDLARMITSGAINAQGNANIAPQSSSAPQSSNAPKAYKFKTYQEMLRALEEDGGERALVSQLERYAKPVRIEDDLFAFEPTKDAPRNLHLKLSQALREMTLRDWKVYIEEQGGQTIDEIRKIEHDELMARTKEDPKVKDVLKLFPGAKIVAIRPQSELKSNNI